MKNKLRVGALLLTAVMLASSVCESAPIVVRAEEAVTQAVGDGGAERGAEEAQNSEMVKVYGQDITFDNIKDWDDKGEFNIALTTEEALNRGATVTMDVLVPEAAYNGIIKIQGVARIGSDWTWTEADSIAELTQDSFGEAENGYRKATVSFAFGAGVEADALAQFTLKFAGYQCDYSGAVYIANVVLTDGEKQENDGDQGETADVLVAERADRQQVYGKEIAFDPSSDWNDQGEFEIGISTEEALHNGAYLTMDVLVPEAARFANCLKVQGVAKVGDDWTWTEAANIPELTIDSFGEAADGYRSATIRFDFGGNIEAGAVKTTLIKLAGYLCDYTGNIYIENIRLYDKQSSGETSMPEKDPSVIDDFEDGTCDDWGNGGAWQYDNNIANTVVEYNGSKMMKVDLDYTGMGSYSWSEAKLENIFTGSFDISAYNLLNFDYYYPAAMSGSKIKIFSNSGINSEAEITEEETLSDGMIRAKVQVKFSPTDKGLADLTIGFVGVNTEFVGSVYVDNITLSQYSAAGDYVKITMTPNADGTQADISHAPTQVRLSDADAGASATALYAYLMALRESDQVLFGHENDINKMVSSTATEGDVREITGSVSGLYGIDSLALTGAELGIADANDALEQAIAYSKQAAGQGAIITLSTHMPNFTNEKIKVNADGSYDFTACDFSEAKDTSNNCAEQILPGGAYNDRFTAYLDIIAEYADALQQDNIPVLFRPYHENTGSWFWWGSSTSVETYKSLWRYTQEYLQSKGVHNLIYVYSPNGPISGAEEYLTRYPGDEYVDVLAFDYYDDYSTYPAAFDDSFFKNLKTTCQVVSNLAAEKGKVAAISETGVRAMKKDGSDYEGLLVTGNPIVGHNWYQQVSDIAAECDMPYWLVWANFGDTNFYVPYKYNDTYGQELINEFIAFYNSENSIFGNGTNFYGKMGSVEGTTYDMAQGYLIAPFELAAIKEETLFRASVKNAENVSFVVKNSVNSKEITVEAAKVEGSIREYVAAFTAQMLQEIGQTDTATVSLVADGKVLATVKNISLGKDKDKAVANVIDNFDYYAGSDGLLQSAYTENSAGGCSSSFTLSSDHKADGAYGGALHYHLSTAKSEVWTGQNKTLEDIDLSAYNAITLWVDPDGMGQKLVIQLADDSGEEFEVYLSDFVKGTEANYVTIPFNSFRGKQNGTLNTAKITRFAIWCNSIISEGHTGDWTVDSVIYFDGIEAFTAEEALLAQADANGLIFTKESPIKREDPAPEDPTPEDPAPEDPTPEDPAPENPTPEDPAPEDPAPEDPTPEDPAPEDPTPEDPTPGTPTPEEPKPENPKPETSQPEAPKTDDSKDNSKASDSGSSDSSAEEIIVNWTEVQVQTTAAKAKDAGGNLNFVSTGETKVPAAVLNSIRGSKVTIAFHSGNGLALSISGQSLKNVDLMGLQNIDLTAKRDGDRITVKDTGSFAVPVNLHVAMGRENAGKYANLYRRNTASGRWEYCGSFRITEVGQAMFALICGGEYRTTVTAEAVKETVVYVGNGYIVKAGDTLSKIAAKHRISLTELIRKNPQIKDINKIRPGQTIRF